MPALMLPSLSAITLRVRHLQQLLLTHAAFGWRMGSLAACS